MLVFVLNISVRFHSTKMFIVKMLSGSVESYNITLLLLLCLHGKTWLVKQCKISLKVQFKYHWYNQNL